MHVRRTGAAAFAAALEAQAAAYEPATVASQLNLLSSHDMPRLRTLLSGDLAAVRLALLLQMTLPGAPCVYYGDEIGMEGGNDPDCRRAFPIGPAGRDEALRATFRDLIAARREHPALRADGLRVIAAADACVAIVRGGGADPSAAGETLVVVANAGLGPRLHDPRAPGARRAAARPACRERPAPPAPRSRWLPTERSAWRSRPDRASSLPRRVEPILGLSGRPPLRAGGRREYPAAPPGRRRGRQDPARAGIPGSACRS